MTINVLRITAILLVLLFATAAFGQSDDWHVSGSIIYNNDDPDRAIDDSVSGIQANVGWNFAEHLTLEGLLGFSSINGYCQPGDCYPDQDNLDFGANLLAFYNRDSVLAPYLLVGVGYLAVGADEGPQYVYSPGDDNNPTTSFGIGIKWHIGQSSFSVRAEHRFRTMYDDINLTDQLTTVGLQYDFGRKPVLSDPAPNQDSDNDGILDMWDACPNTPAGVQVSSRGCELKNLDQDDDQDNILNSIDQCPNTPLGVPVDRRGCSLDSDGDGVTTDKDRCPASRVGADVNIYGCENDNDEDGVVDHRDKCLFTSPGVRVDVQGCEIKDIINLPGVNFESGQDILLPGTDYLLQTAADTLNAHPDLMIQVAGHTDNVGNADQNIGLSMRRAKTVRAFLIGFGVDESRLSFKGYGAAEPIADNSTADGRATNRRVELRLISN